MQQSLQFNGLNWKVFHLGENTILLQAPSDVSIEEIHHSTNSIKEALSTTLKDIVPSYDSIALFHDGDFEEMISILGNHKSNKLPSASNSTNVKIPICYEYGLDLEKLATHAGITIERLIQIHLNGEYRAVLIGFTPGFVYMDGLDPQLACPRLSNPRKRLDPGSVGIGGEQTGIYSLASPGGWNIVGRTPLHLFDPTKDDPMSIDVGSRISYQRITREEFDSWES